jgi:hypothetical protein
MSIHGYIGEPAAPHRYAQIANVEAGHGGGVSGVVDVFPGTTASGKVRLQAAASAGDYTLTITNASLAAARTVTIPDPGAAASFVMTEGNQTINGTKTFSGSIVRASRQIVIPICGNAKVGATAGWVITGGTNICHATLPASQSSGSTLVVPITGLEIGDTLTAVDVVGQVESAGNTVNLVLSVRKLTSGAADNTDAELATDNVGNLAADTVLSSANLGVTGLTEVLAANESLYALLTGTTNASTDIDLMSLVVTVTRS